MKLLFAVVAILCVKSIYSDNGTIRRPSYNRVCYYSYPSTLRPSAIDAHLCTHINFAFALVSNCSVVPEHPGDSVGYGQLRTLKQANPHLKLLFSLGGGGHSTIGFQQMVASPQNVSKFIARSISYVRRYGFDGLDFDWEFPQGKYVPLFAAFLQKFRDVISKSKDPFVKNFLLTAAVSSNAGSYNVTSLAQTLDMVNVMTYDFNSFGGRHTTAFNSPLYAEPKEQYPLSTRNTDFAMRHWMRAGVPAKKLNLGLPAYGRGYILANATEHGFHAKAKADGGTPTFPVTCKSLKSGASYVFDNSSKVPYMFKDDLWVSFDDVQSYMYKSKYIREHGLGGSMTWELNSDDWSGSCGIGPFPLHNVLKKMLQ